MNENNLTRRRLMQWLAATMMGTAFSSRLKAGTTPADLFHPNNTGDLKPVFIPPGEGEKGKIGDSEIVFKLDMSQTSGNLGNAETILQPGVLGRPAALS